MTYGNGLMHVGNAGRSYLHHTGGMVSFSSSFHVDVASGVGAFASTTISAFAEYRPRLLTRFAVDALTNALAGTAAAGAAAAGRRRCQRRSLCRPLFRARRRVRGPRRAAPLTIVANGQSAALQPCGGESVPHDPSRLSANSALMFERKGNAITGASWGLELRARRQRRACRPSDPALAKLAGRYVNDNPWCRHRHQSSSAAASCGSAPKPPMTQIGDNLWRVGEESWSPERALLRRTSSTGGRRPSSSRARSSSATISRRRPSRARRAAKSAAMDVLEAPASPPKSSPSTASRPKNMSASSTRSAASRTCSSSASSRSCGRSIAATKARASI